MIYGGRNDRVYESTGGVGLNDISIYNINLNQWEALAMFGQQPICRWKHCMIAMNNQQQSDGIMILGGVNLHQHCRSQIFTFQIMNKKREKPNSQRKEKEEKNQVQQVMQLKEAQLLNDQNLQKIALQAAVAVDGQGASPFLGGKLPLARTSSMTAGAQGPVK